MTKPFKGIVNMDIHDLTPDWALYEGLPRAVYSLLERN